MKTKKTREEAAARHFSDHRAFGTMFLNFMEYGHEVDVDGGTDGFYVVDAECPDDVRHARSLSAKKYAELMRTNIVQYLATPAGLRDLRAITDQMHQELVEAGEGDDGDE